MQILVTGACGYKGTVLIPKLLKLGHQVIALDIMWFGNFLRSHPNLTIIEEDVRNIDSIILDCVDCIIHLSSVANDPCGDLDPKLTWEISALATMQLADKAVRNNVKQFIYASSGSVYGIKKEESVTEDLPLKPISEYNKTKMVSERVLLSYADKMKVQILRPATVCGISERMRLDVSVNMLTMQALKNKKITVFGGSQIRPNIHIDDITDVYVHFIKNPNIEGIFNAGFENLSILEIADLISNRLQSEVVILESNDPRSYRLNSDKLIETGFKPKKNVSKAIDEIILSYRDGKIDNHDHFHNLKWMEKKIFKKKL